MTCMFPPFLTLFSSQKEKPDCLESNKNREDSNTLPVRAQQTGQGAELKEIKSIAKRKPVFLGHAFRRMWASLKYRTELEKARSDCKKFLVSLSGRDFDLRTATNLCAPMKNFDSKEFRTLFEETINGTVDRLSKELIKRNRPLVIETQANLNSTINGFFDSGRQTNYKTAFSIAEEFKKVLMPQAENQAKKAEWKLKVKSKPNKNE